jgi:hypothetical protein
VRTSSAWVLCAVAAAGCGLQNPDVRVAADVVALEAGMDLGAPLDVPVDKVVATDEGDSAVELDGGEDVVELDSGEDAAEADAVDIDVPDVSEDAAPDASMGDAPDAAAPDAPMDIPDAADVPLDTAVDGGRDAPPEDSGSPVNWHVTDGDALTTPWRDGTPPSDSIATLYCGPGQLLVGLTTWSSLYVSGLAPWCALLNADGTLGMAVRGGRQGGTWGGSEDDLCPARQAIVRFTINAGAVVDRLQATCAPVAGWLARRELGAALRSHGDSTGGARHQDDCNDGYVGNGFELRSGDFNLIERVRNLRLRCARVSDH